MKTLSIDLGTKTGYAYWENDELKTCGTELLIKPKEVTLNRKAGIDRSKDPRVFRLHQFVRQFKPDEVVFEDVLFASTQMQAQMWSSLRAALWTALPDARFYAVPVQTLKVFATGKGNAQKEDMARALELKCMPLPPLDDNGVDAIWLGLWLREHR
jgi:Holliday junction resolvasome RuvABC endonuclease subunit